MVADEYGDRVAGRKPSRIHALASALTRSSSSRYVIVPPSSITAVAVRMPRRGDHRSAAEHAELPRPRITSAVAPGLSIPNNPLRKHSAR